MQLLSVDEILTKIMKTRSGDNTAQPFRVERDVYGFATGIYFKDRRLLNLAEGDVLNERNIDKLVRLLNAAVVIAKIHLDNMESEELVAALQDVVHGKTKGRKKRKRTCENCIYFKRVRDGRGHPLNFGVCVPPLPASIFCEESPEIYLPPREMKDWAECCELYREAISEEDM